MSTTNADLVERCVGCKKRCRVKRPGAKVTCRACREKGADERPAPEPEPEVAAPARARRRRAPKDDAVAPPERDQPPVPAVVYMLTMLLVLVLGIACVRHGSASPPALASITPLEVKVVDPEAHEASRKGRTSQWVSFRLATGELVHYSSDLPRYDEVAALLARGPTLRLWLLPSEDLTGASIQQPAQLEHEGRVVVSYDEMLVSLKGDKQVALWGGLGIIALFVYGVFDWRRKYGRWI